MLSFILRLLLLLGCFASQGSSTVTLNGYGLYIHNPAQIEQAFQFFDNNTLIIGNADNFYPLELGKALGYMANYFKWSDKHHLKFCLFCAQIPTIIFKQAQDMFFIWNNLQRPLPAPSDSSYLKMDSMQMQTGGPSVGFMAPPTLKINVQILNKQLALNQLALLTSQQTSRQDKEEEVVIHNFQDQTIIFPMYCDENNEKTTYQYLRDHIQNASNSLSTLPVDENIANSISTTIQEFLAFTDNTLIRNLGRVVFSEEYEFVDKNSNSAYIPYLQEGMLKQTTLNTDEVIYSESDESFTLWLNDDRTKAYLIDAGSLFLSRGLKALVNNSENVGEIHVTITHFHLDHTQTLAPFIIESASATTTVHLYMPDGLIKGFVGWFIQFNVEMSPLIDNGSLQIHFVDDHNIHDFGGYPTKFAYSWRLVPSEMNHVVPNVSPVLNFGNNKYMIVAGDLTPSYVSLQNSASFFMKNEGDEYGFFFTIRDWINSVLEFANIPPNSTVDLYFYTGMFQGVLHFIGDQDSIKYKRPTKLYDYLETNFQDDLTLSVVETHVKSSDFKSKIHTMFS